MYEEQAKALLILLGIMVVLAVVSRIVNYLQ